jgi:hypothetical protein
MGSSNQDLIAMLIFWLSFLWATSSKKLVVGDRLKAQHTHSPAAEVREVCLLSTGIAMSSEPCLQPISTHTSPTQNHKNLGIKGRISWF